MCLDLSTRSIQRVLAHFQTYGTIPNPGDGTVEKMRVGKRHLHDVDVEVMAGNATVDTKPSIVPAHTARSHTRNMGSGTVVDQYPSAGQHSYPSPPVTVQVMPPWPGTAQGYHGGNGTLYPPFSQQTIHLPPAAPAYPLSPNLQPTIPQPPALSPFDPVVISNSSETTRQAPKVVPWFNYLEQREKDPPCGVKFGVFGPMLEAKGFVRISQLSHDYISVEVLQRLLGIEMGTAVLIFQYVEADMWAISSGRSVLPEEF
ncbi:hypothetical protein PISMIDRAFT_676084 [Pisolithus microcarpus 441]|uniref:Uncharacterized protein n=1 Tax=Pisolithus microcarpus 441 TaxID=765257 RepID=A0A0C9ZVN8_9AGAM|nr:hypothetical protein PISMIDRAFT_676084 [Pisolithus microcarpus 441]